MSKRGCGEGSIYEEQPGKWVASITVGYEFKDGKRRRIRKKFSAPTRGAVKAKMTDALKAQQDGFSVAPVNQTISHFLNYWLDHVVPNATKPKTATFYRYIATTHIIPSIGKIQIQKLTSQHVQALLNEKLATTKLPRAKKSTKGREDPAPPPAATLSARTVRHIHRTLCTALETAVKYGTVPRNVATLVDPPRLPKAPMKFLSIDQARAVLVAAAGEPLSALFTTILSVGLRLGEALGLAWDDVDLARGRLRICHTLQRVRGEMKLLEPKTEDSVRTVELPAVAIAALAAHRGIQRSAKEWAGTGWKGNSWNLVFTSATGSPLDERSVLRIFQDRILVKAEVPKMRIHDLRHSAVAILLAQGVDARQICELLGHSSVAFTLQVYGHLMEETKRETASKMDAALAPQNPVAPSLAPSEPKSRVM